MKEIRNAATDILLPSDYPSDAAMFQHLENEEARLKAYTLYIAKEMKPSVIAVEIGIPVNTVRLWVARGGWNKRLAESRLQRATEEEFALALFRDDNRLGEVEAQLKAGKRGREIVMEMLESGEITSPGQLKQLGEALKSFSDVAARAVGLGETVETKGAQEDARNAGKMRPPAVVIVAGEGSKIQVQEQAT